MNGLLNNDNFEAVQALQHRLRNNISMLREGGCEVSFIIVDIDWLFLLEELVFKQSWAGFSGGDPEGAKFLDVPIAGQRGIGDTIKFLDTQGRQHIRSRL